MRPRRAASTCLLLAACAAFGSAQQVFKRTDSRAPYVHEIDLYDATGRKIDPAAGFPAPYSPRVTCGKCHDVEAMERGWHFNAAQGGPAGRRGEPFFFVDRRSATSLPLSLRGWPGTFRPEAAGQDPARFLAAFGRHLPGGSTPYLGAQADAFGPRGGLEVDCLACHDASRHWSLPHWADQLKAGNFAWAPTVAAGLGAVTGSARDLPGDFDSSAPDAARKLPHTRYDPRRFDAAGKVFFDLVRRPPDAACHACHSVRIVGETQPTWIHDGDVHLRAGLSCVDCHRNGLAHHTVRGFEGEEHPSGVDVKSLSCRGCHLDATDGHGGITARGGRLGAPPATHPGLPPIHLELLSCTACHSGPRPAMRLRRVQTSLAHALGLPSQTRTAQDAPLIVEPVFLKNDRGRIAPHRMAWPSFFAWWTKDSLEPMVPQDAARTLRRALRVRRDLLAETARGLVDAGARRAALQKKLEKGLAALQGDRKDKAAVFVARGRVHAARLRDGKLVPFRMKTFQPVAWPLAHDVRPARDSLGISGCHECHAADSPFMYATVSPLGPAASPDDEPVPMHAMMELDPELLQAWERSFDLREEFKWTGFVAVGCTLMAVLLYLLLAASRLGRRGRPDPVSDDRDTAA